jgi:hypothetical protein
MTYYDDNFGCWEDMDDPEMLEFYDRVQDSNVEKICVDCGRLVRIQPHYECCNSCANRREQGW